jgi:autotransporter-associated beta strand protein
VDIVTVANVISGSGSLTQNGSGTLVLGAANTFTGAVLVAQGTVQIGNNSALGTTNGSTTIVSGATLDFVANANNIGQEQVIASGSGVGGGGALINSSGVATFVTPNIARLTLANDSTIGGSGRWDLRASTTSDPSLASLSTLGQPRKLTKVGPNQVSIVGVTVDSAMGDIDIQGGTLSMETATTSLGNTASNLIVEAGATFQVFAITNLLNKVITLNGDGVATTLNESSGANTIIGPMSLNGSVIFGVGGTSLTLNGPLSGTGHLTKNGNSPLTINGDGSLLTGGVTVAAGALTLNGILGGGITNTTGATILAGTGTNTGVVDSTGIIFPGASNVVGTLTVGGLLLESGAILTYDLGSDTTPGSGSNDLIVVNGDFTVNGNQININPLGLLKAGPPYRLLNYTGNLIWNVGPAIPDVSGYHFTVDTNTPGQVNVIVSGGPPVWTGGSPTDSNWSDSANWGGQTVGTGSLLYFAGNNRVNNTNDIIAGTAFSDINFVTGAGAFVLNGNPITISTAGTSIINNSANAETVNLGVGFSSGFNLSGGPGGLVVGGGLTNTALAGTTTTVTLGGTGTLTNLLYSVDPAATNVLALVSTNANWTMMDNSSATAITNPVQLDMQAGTFTFGQSGSAPNLDSSTTIVNSRLGVLANAPATFNMVNGALTLAARLNTGTAANSVATLNQTGGTLNLLALLQVSDGSPTAGSTVNVTGGTLNVGPDTGRNSLFVASRGTGVVSIASSGTVNCGTLDMSRNAAGNTQGSVGVVNLNSGGTLSVTRVGAATSASQAGGTPTANFNFNGGTLKAAAANVTYQGNAAAPAIPIITTVKAAGAVVDSLTNAITIAEPMQHDGALGSIPDGGLAKLGAGTLTLSAANTFTGPTVVNNGTLVVNGSLGLTAVTVGNGGTLSGTGSAGSNVTVNVGGTLAPGRVGVIGTFTVASNAVLNGTAVMDINAATGTNDVLKATSITYGGTLSVSNLSGTLRGGASFKLFSSGTGMYGGAFGAYQLPPLWPGLSWVTSALGTSGTISVNGAIIPPRITGTSLSGNTVTISGSGGLPGGVYYVLESTSVAQPLATWTRIATNNFDASGNFLWTGTPHVPVLPAAFYAIQGQ